MDALAMSFSTEVMLTCSKPMILVDTVNHPAKMILVLALVASVICDYVQVFVLRLGWCRNHVFFTINFFVQQQKSRLKK